MTEQTSRRLTGLEAEDGALAPNLGSPDGRWLSGAIFTPTGDFRGIGVHDRERGRTYKLTADAIDQYVDWLPDSRQVVYFTRRGTLVTQDILTLIRREVAVTLPYPPDQTGSIAVAPDGRTLYYVTGFRP